MLELIVEAPDGAPRRREPVTCGVPWPRGVVRDISRLALRDERDRPVSLQARAIDRWSDGSVRWALLDWQAEVEARAIYRVAVVEAAELPAGIRPAVEADGGLAIDTGAAVFRLGAGRPFPFASVLVRDEPAIDPTRTRFTVEDGAGRRYDPAIARAEVVEAGPLRTAVRLEGDLAGPTSGPLARFTAHLNFFAGFAAVRFDITIRNPRRAVHPHNLWDLGDAGSIFLRDVVLTVALPAGETPATIRGSAEPGLPWRHFGRAVEIYQDSSGGANWQSTVHVNRHRVVPNTFRGYRMHSDGAEESGLRATPIVALERGTRFLAVAMEYFWQNFPKALEADRDALTLRLFPRQYADVHELQGGEQKTHTFVVAFGRDAVTDEPLAWCRAPLRPRAEPSWYCGTGVVSHLIPRADDPNDVYLRLVDAAIEGDDTFFRKREVIDEYGWRHFGELYADHEAVFHRGPQPLVSHYNNQYDVIGGCALQFLRSGDWRWWALMHEMARHVADIDVYHTDGDKSAYNHGLFWHTYHYVDAGTSTHRAYSTLARIPGGGPSGGHNYTTGLMLHHFLTGDPLSREAAIGLARYVIDADDGRKTAFRWLASGYTGHVSASGALAYHGPGRAPANSINALLDGHRLTGDSAFLDKAGQIIRRCIHPADDIAARDLLNAELRWFYTMFLQALSRYLDYKAELGQLDSMYAYARASLLHYARWMAEHEHPYLDKPEILEYPTETWAAQDMRKSEVFEHAARVAEDAEREQLLERSRFFHEYATTSLSDMPTHSLARPVALLLSNGLARAHSQLNPDPPRLPIPPGIFDYGAPELFTPQKVRAIRRLKVLAGVGLFAAGALAIGLLARLVL